MILSASRRTDIPAYYSEWFLNRLCAGEVVVPYPRNQKRFGRVPLSPEVVDCIVFWTKDPFPMLNKLQTIWEMGYPFYFEMTFNPYDAEVERCLPSKEKRLESFRKLSDRWGKDSVDWRYDPVIVNERFSVPWHLEEFGKLCESLHSFTSRAIFSFVDSYGSMGNRITEVERESMFLIAQGFSRIASEYHLPLFACAEEADFRKYGIYPASCIDQSKIEQRIGCPIVVKKDRGQRLACGCVESVDIGMYNTCGHGCVYCYATTDFRRARRQMEMHRKDSPLLIGELPEEKEGRIIDWSKGTLKDGQRKLF